MMSRNSIFVFLLMLLASLVSCKNNKQKSIAADVGVEVDDPASQNKYPSAGNENVVEHKVEYSISNGVVSGVRAGKAISELDKILSKRSVEVGKGSTLVYDIRSEEGIVLGYATPSKSDQSKVGDIVITSPNVVTEKGLSVGDLFSDLHSIYPNAVPQGSETDKRVSVDIGNLNFQLDAYVSKYDLEPNTIRPTTKISQITIKE